MIKAERKHLAIEVADIVSHVNDVLEERKEKIQT